jgi:hypothetical protein
MTIMAMLSRLRVLACLALILALARLRAFPGVVWVR